MPDPSTCPHCKGPMKPLFTGFYCPKDCDKPEVQAKKKADRDVFNKKVDELLNATAQPKHWVWHLATPYYTPPMADDQCRDFYCSGKGKWTHTAYTSLGSPTSQKQDHYTCTICQKTWFVLDPKWPPSTSATPTGVVN